MSIFTFKRFGKFRQKSNPKSTYKEIKVPKGIEVHKKVRKYSKLLYYEDRRTASQLKALF